MNNYCSNCKEIIPTADLEGTFSNRTGLCPMCMKPLEEIYDE